MILSGTVTRRAGPMCRIHGLVIVRLMDASGRLLPVRGNPARTMLIASVGPSGVSAPHPVLFAWQNWCRSSPTSFEFSVASAAKQAVFHWDTTVPSCLNPSAPPTLRPFTDRGVVIATKR